MKLFITLFLFIPVYFSYNISDFVCKEIINKVNTTSLHEYHFVSMPKIKIKEKDLYLMVEEYVPKIKSTCRLNPKNDIICVDFYHNHTRNEFILYPISLRQGIPDILLESKEIVGYLKVSGIIVVLYGDDNVKKVNVKKSKKRKKFKISYVVPCEDGDYPYWLFSRENSYKVEVHPTDEPWNFMKNYVPYK